MNVKDWQNERTYLLKLIAHHGSPEVGWGAEPVSSYLHAMAAMARRDDREALSSYLHVAGDHVAVDRWGDASDDVFTAPIDGPQEKGDER